MVAATTFRTTSEQGVPGGATFTRLVIGPHGIAVRYPSSRRDS